ncbi:bifunctional diguanylate cyclase/phosphodiesterase [Thiomicrospira microaerophila]|uniref:bifunctional diguanylate cyclase/phosphodiesterase n=1 Tax=Thiomicrospira microaerophila TaxID=406020 RepID=UPI000698E9F5|nr:EAL domain-containing protein [Thiomicrospira microaerophila]
MKTISLHKATAIGLVLLWLFSFWFVNQRYQIEKQLYFDRQIQEVSLAWRATVQTHQQSKQAYFETYVQNPIILDWVKAAHLDTMRNQARDALYQEVAIIYQQMRRNGVFQFQFTLPNNQSLLRLHSPTHFGDDLTEVRSSFRKANELMKPIHGFELGRVVPGFRSVFPLFIQAEHIGAVEISTQFETLRRDMSQLDLGREFGIIFARDAQDTVFERLSTYFIPSQLALNWVMEDPARQSLHNTPLPSLYMNQMRAELSRIDVLSRYLEKGEPFVASQKVNRITQLAVFIPIHDIEGQLISYLFAFSPAPMLDKLVLDTTLQVLFSSLFLLLLGFVVFRLLRHQDDLRVAATAFNVQEGVLITDAQGMIIRVNDAFSQLTGYLSIDVVGKTPAILNSGRQSKAFYQLMWTELKRNGYWLGEIWNRKKNGEEYIERLSIRAVYDQKQKVTHYVGAFFDITQSKADESEIRRLAFFDHLTQLANRRLLMDRLEHALASSHQSEHFAALLFIDLDRFKILNDTKGHAYGDQLLVEVASRLKQSVREVDTISRFGGDEFIVLAEGLSQEKHKAAYEAEQLAEKIRAALSSVYQFDHFEHVSSPSIGIVLFKDHEDGTAEDIVCKADSAMYQAKQAGRNTIKLFDPKMQTLIEERLALESDLKSAIENNQFELLYQPQLNAQNRVIGAEALIRWHHPERGLVSPAEFIPLAEQSELILLIGDWVLHEAVRSLAKWKKNASLAHLTLAVNISAQQIHQVHFVEHVQEYIKEYVFDPKNLKLELTESMMLMDIEDSVDKMQRLRKLGVQFSMDDFGTGYASLLSIKDLPLNQLKIDRSFIQDLLSDTSAHTLTRTIIQMSAELGLDVIAEGVETQEQMNALLNMACDGFQGYLFSKPLSYSDFMTYLIKP